KQNQVPKLTLKGKRICVELLMLLFLNNLAEEAKAKAFEEKSAVIRSQHVRAVSKKMLKKARG
uniref:Centromere protein W n=1 Tax=Mastacembelus armatus TaxID=205130 RepID=A0A7N8XLS9_9TELE